MLYDALIKSKLQHPLWGKPQALDYFICPGSREFDKKGPTGGGGFDLCLGGVGKIEQEVSGSNDFFLWGGEAKSLTAINKYLEKMEFKRRDIAIS